MKSSLFRQYNLKGVGTFVNVFYLTAPLLGMMMYFVNAMTFYTVASPQIHRYFPWMNLILFLIILIISMIILMVLFYMFVYPAYYAFLNKQTYIHENPMQRDLQLLKDDSAKSKEDMILVKRALGIKEELTYDKQQFNRGED